MLEQVEIQAFLGRSREPEAGSPALEAWGLVLEKAPAEEFGFVGSSRVVLRLVSAEKWRAAAARLGPGLSRLRWGSFSLPDGVDWALAQGWQCWSESPVVSRTGSLQEDRHRERWCYGDTVFYPYEEKPGCFHSWFTSLCGSFSQPEEQGFFAINGGERFACCFVFDLQAGHFFIDMDVEGLDGSRLSDGETLVDVVFPKELRSDRSLQQEGHNWVVRMLGHSTDRLTGRPSPTLGYTSWYHHYHAITENLLLKNLEACPDFFRVFQIDDGYQKSIGEWLDYQKDFAAQLSPEGLMAKIHERGCVPGLWLAPFVASESSALLERSPEFVLHDAAGEPVRCGTNDNWGGHFYALDTESQAFRKWLEETVDVWCSRGVGFFKCDFLYAAGVIPGGGFTRLERACRAHRYLGGLIAARGRSFLSCGAILEQAFGSCDYARVGADVAVFWEDPDESYHHSRERVSTRSCITNTITRSFLNGSAFLNDGDVTVLRGHDTGLTLEERRQLLHVNRALSDLQFVSCDLFDLRGEGKDLLGKLEQTERFSHIDAIIPRFDHDGSGRVGGWAVGYEVRGRLADINAPARGKPKSLAFELGPCESH